MFNIKVVGGSGDYSLPWHGNRVACHYSIVQVCRRKKAVTVMSIDRNKTEGGNPISFLHVWNIIISSSQRGLISGQYCHCPVSKYMNQLWSYFFLVYHPSRHCLLSNWRNRTLPQNTLSNVNGHRSVISFPTSTSQTLSLWTTILQSKILIIIRKAISSIRLISWFHSDHIALIKPWLRFLGTVVKPRIVI